MMISFGHFIRQSSPVNSLIALQTARPARGVIDDTSDGAIFGLNKNEKVMLSSFLLSKLCRVCLCPEFVLWQRQPCRFHNRLHPAF